MFKRRSIQMSVVKTPKTAGETGTVTSHITVNPEDIKKYVKLAVLATMSLYATKVVMDTASEIAINLTTK